SMGICSIKLLCINERDLRLLIVPVRVRPPAGQRLVTNSALPNSAPRVSFDKAGGTCRLVRTFGHPIFRVARSAYRGVKKSSLQPYKSPSRYGRLRSSLQEKTPLRRLVSEFRGVSEATGEEACFLSHLRQHEGRETAPRLRGPRKKRRNAAGEKAPNNT